MQSLFNEQPTCTIRGVLSLLIAALSLVAGTVCLADAPGKRSLSVCIIDEPYWPVSAPDQELQGQAIVRQAVVRQGGMVRFMPVPWRRCIEGVRAGTYDAALGAAANPSYLEFLSFPMKGDQVDSQLAVGRVSTHVLRRRGGDTEWDGKRFTNLHGPVWHNTNTVALRGRLAALKVPDNEGVKSTQQLLQMLMLRPEDVALVRKHDVEDLLLRAPFRDEFELLPVPFMERDAHFAVRRALYLAEPAYFKQLWAEIGRLRQP
ncbi:MAG: hypothetical protein V4508_03350 [Pseudomonadota bacterium]